jgi:hypothetical protein
MRSAGQNVRSFFKLTGSIEVLTSFNTIRFLSTDCARVHRPEKHKPGVEQTNLPNIHRDKLTPATVDRRLAAGQPVTSRIAPKRVLGSRGNEPAGDFRQAQAATGVVP